MSPGVARPASPCRDLSYTYGPAGNITHIQDSAQQTVYFRNRRVDAEQRLHLTTPTTGSLKRLAASISVRLAAAQAPPTRYDPSNGFQTRLLHPSYGNAMSTYLGRFVYDIIGNIESMMHRGTDPANPGWVRRYQYDETEPA